AQVRHRHPARCAMCSSTFHRDRTASRNRRFPGLQRRHGGRIQTHEAVPDRWGRRQEWQYAWSFELYLLCSCRHVKHVTTLRKGALCVVREDCGPVPHNARNTRPATSRRQQRKGMADKKPPVGDKPRPFIIRVGTSREGSAAFVRTRMTVQHRKEYGKNSRKRGHPSTAAMFAGNPGTALAAETPCSKVNPDWRPRAAHGRQQREGARCRCCAASHRKRCPRRTLPGTAPCAVHRETAPRPAAHPIRATCGSPVHAPAQNAR